MLYTCSSAQTLFACSLLSKYRKVSRYKCKYNFIYTRLKRMAFCILFLRKLSNAQNHYV